LAQFFCGTFEKTAFMSVGFVNSIGVFTSLD
jgi:hypothetical protein